MSATIESETPSAVPTEEVAPPAPLTLDELLAAVEDGSRFSEGTNPAELAEDISKTAKLLKQSVVTVSTRRKNMAEMLANARRHVLHPDGRPDWEGQTGTWQAISKVAYDDAFADLGKAESDREKNAIRQHMARTYLEVAIRAYVAESKDIGGELVFPTEDTYSSEAFLFAVRRQYKDAGLSIPTRYMTPEDKAAAGHGGGGPGVGSKNPAEVALKGIEGLNQVVPAMHAKAALRSVSDIVKRVTAPDAGAIAHREQVKEDLERISTIALYGLKYLDGKSNEKDRATVAELLWTDADATADVS